MPIQLIIIRFYRRKSEPICVCRRGYISRDFKNDRTLRPRRMRINSIKIDSTNTILIIWRIDHGIFCIPHNHARIDFIRVITNGRTSHLDAIHRRIALLGIFYRPWNIISRGRTCLYISSTAIIKMPKLRTISCMENMIRTMKKITRTRFCIVVTRFVCPVRHPSCRISIVISLIFNSPRCL